jgi:hypothetical protein
VATAEHVRTFISIVVGLALTDIAHSLHRLLRAGRGVRWDPLAPMAALLVTASVVNTWWTADLVYAHAKTFAAILPNLVSLILLFLVASAVFPDAVPAEGMELKAYYLDNRRYFWGLFILWVTALVINEALVSASLGRSALDILSHVWGNLVFLPLFGLLMWTRNRWVHGMVLAFCLLVIVGSWAFDNVASVRAAGAAVG